MTDEHRLIRLCQSGNREALDSLFRNYDESITRMVIYFCGSKYSHADMRQEVFVSLCASIKRFAFKSSFSTFLYALIRNICYAQMRRETRLFSIRKKLQLSSPVHFNADYDKIELKIILNNALEYLSSKYREPLLLFEYEDLTYQEISGILSIPEGTVKSRISKAREKLLKLFNTRYQKRGRS